MGRHEVFDADAILTDVSGRRRGAVAALTAERGNLIAAAAGSPPHLAKPTTRGLALYTSPRGEWCVRPPKELPSPLPAPAAGIDRVLEGMDTKKWLRLVAMHTDAWLFSVATFLSHSVRLATLARQDVASRVAGHTPLWEVAEGNTMQDDDAGCGGENGGRARAHRAHARRMLSHSLVFADWRSRRNGVARALTSERQTLRAVCELQCRSAPCALHVTANGVWQILPEVQALPSRLPLPSSGINLAFDDLPESEWLHLLALHSDAWLAARAIYMAHALHLPRSDRQSLARAILAEPPLYKLAERWAPPAPESPLACIPRCERSRGVKRPREAPLFGLLGGGCSLVVPAACMPCAVSTGQRDFTSQLLFVLACGAWMLSRCA